MRRFISTLGALCLIAASSSSASAESAPLVESPTTKVAHWTLSLLGGGAFPLNSYADDRELGLAARATLAYTSRIGIGAAISAGYSPLSPVDQGDDVRREHHIGVASLAPRYTLGKGTIRVFLGGGGGLLYERTKSQPRSNAEPAVTTDNTAAAAIAEAGIELHFGGSGVTIGGTYLRGVGKSTNAELAAAQAGFVLSF